MKGTARVDYLNDLCKKFSNVYVAYHYSKQAYDEAAKIDYKYGLAISLIELGLLRGTFPTGRANIKQAISIGGFFA